MVKTLLKSTSVVSKQCFKPVKHSHETGNFVNFGKKEVLIDIYFLANFNYCLLPAPELNILQQNSTTRVLIDSRQFRQPAIC